VFHFFILGEFGIHFNEAAPGMMNKGFFRIILSNFTENPACQPVRQVALEKSVAKLYFPFLKAFYLFYQAKKKKIVNIRCHFSKQKPV
jgi:hypothetical protein